MSDMEICCANCKNDYWGCPNNKKRECLDYPLDQISQIRGKYNKYYNHFTPKEEKVFYCKSCGNSLSEGEMCRCVIPNSWKSHILLPSKVEHKPTGKSLTAREVIAESKITISETNNFLKWVSKSTSLIDNNLFAYSTFLPYALQHTCFRDFLLAGGYIEKVDAWVPVKYGDTFKYNNETFMLCQVEAKKIILTTIQGYDKGNRYSEMVSVGNVKGITKSEFQKICGSIPVDELERI